MRRSVKLAMFDWVYITTGFDDVMFCYFGRGLYEGYIWGRPFLFRTSALQVIVRCHRRQPLFSFSNISRSARGQELFCGHGYLFVIFPFDTRALPAKPLPLCFLAMRIEQFKV
jgi:hypothetical protein